MPAPRFGLLLVALALATPTPLDARDEPSGAPEPDPSDAPDTDSSVDPGQAGSPLEVLAAMEPEALAELVPGQAGLRFARCPSCEATEAEDPLSWSIRAPDSLTCRRCGQAFPNESIPAKVKDAVPEEAIEVRPGVVHRYPYHEVAPHRASYPGQRVYLEAKRHDAARAFLSRACLELAARHRDGPSGDGRDGLRAAVLLLRFAQVYPDFAVHYDQVDRPKFFQPADLSPPYREGFRTAKWDWSGASNVPIPLASAYAILRGDPAIDEAARLLGEGDPRGRIEDGFFRPAAEFLLGHPDPHDERSIVAARGLIVAGRLLGEPRFVAAGLDTLDNLARRGFYFDGHWRDADPMAHRRVVGMLDGWLRDSSRAAPTIPAPEIPPPDAGLQDVAGGEVAAILALARYADAASITGPDPSQVRLAAWPVATPRAAPRRASLLGGVGLARLAAGEGADAIDVELRGFGDHDRTRFDRLALRLSFGGRPVLDDLDAHRLGHGGWGLTTAAHNAVTIDGRNQRETPARARLPRPGSDILFFAAEPDLQVALMSDRHAYPESSRRYRRLVAAVSDGAVRYVVDVFDVAGGTRHDQFFHAPPGSSARWELAGPAEDGPGTLLPDGVRRVEGPGARDGRWFVESYAGFGEIRHLDVDGPNRAILRGPDGPILALHALDFGPRTFFAAEEPDRPGGPDGRGALMIRRESADGSTMSSRLVRLYEPTGGRSGLRRLGRVAAPDEVVVLALETVDGLEHLVINADPGRAIEVATADGRTLRTDGLLVRSRPDGLVLAGGTFAEHGPHRVRQPMVEGRVRSAVRSASEGSRGWFEVDAAIPEPDRLAGRTLLIAHGEAASRGWTIARVQPHARNRARLFVREEPGFALDERGDAAYYQFPGAIAPGPHAFTVPSIARSDHPSVSRR